MKLENIKIEYVNVRCRGGAELSQCIREAAMLALEQEETVTFKHNDREYVVDFKAIVDSVYKQHLA